VLRGLPFAAVPGSGSSVVAVCAGLFVAFAAAACGSSTPSPNAATAAGPSSAAAAPAPAPAAPSAGLGSLRGKVIVIDPGHNLGNVAHSSQIGRPVFAGVPENNGFKPCDTTGTATAHGYAEAAYTWDVARRLVAILRRAGAKVILTRTGTRPSYGPCIDQRARIGNRAHADAAVSIHADGGLSRGHGFALIAPASPIAATRLTQRMVDRDVALARALRKAYLAGTGVPVSTYLGSHGIYRSNEYGGTNLSHVPKVFIETANMRNAGDAALLVQPRFRARAARSLAAGLAAFLR
jgi:N-acetylmuramoyl-L-alanine amidase